MAMLRIGDDRREATDWLQDRMSTTRPLAERAMIALLRDGVAVTTNDGIMLAEADEEEAERRARTSLTITKKTFSRDYRRSRGMKLYKKQMGKLVKTDFSSAADDMIHATLSGPDPDPQED